MSEPPVFIGGLQKSGTTLVRALLGQHSAFASGLETSWCIINFEEMRSDAAVRTTYCAKMSAFFGISEEALEKAVLSARTPAEFLSSFMLEVQQLTGKRRWLEKTPENVTAVPQILEQWPTAKVIHVVRTPLDVFASHIRNGRTRSAEEFVGHWGAFMVSAIDQARACADRQYAFLRYESLVTSVEPTMIDLLAFVAEAWEPAVARHDGNDTEYERVLAVTGKSSATLRAMANPLSPNHVGTWSETLSKAQVDEFNEAVERKGFSQLIALMEGLQGVKLFEKMNLP